jgi:hypothetical protein
MSDSEPVAWAVMLADGYHIYDVYSIAEEAKAIDEVVAGNHGVISLYRSPTLTDAEREVVENAAAFIHDKGLHRQSPSMVADAATLRGLLERTRNGAVDGCDPGQ